MQIKYPDYNNCITNAANSILKVFGIDEGKSTLALLDPYLKKEYKNIVVLLLDGMGKNIVDQNLAKDGFFHRHLCGTYSSVFPPTTVAATTAILSGKNPCESGWLGWDCYFPQIDKNVTVFLNQETGTDKPAADFNVAWTYCGYENIVERIKKAGTKAYIAAPFMEPYPQDFEGIVQRIQDLCSESGKKYIYAYWREPDYTMHLNGCVSREAKSTISKLEEQVQELCSNLQDTLFIITADHGHINSKGVVITDYPRIMDCLIRMPSIEPRALNFFVKPEKKQQFTEEFHKEFGEKFLLLTKSEVLEQKLFGVGKEHPCFRDMLGDYLAVAIDDLSIYSTREEAEMFLGVHAGLTKDEMTIPLIVIEKL